MRRTHTIGVDVSDSSIKVLELDAEARVVAFGTAPLQEHVVQNGTILNKESFVETLTEILKNTQPTVLQNENNMLRAVLCLPETKLFTHFLFVPDTVSKGEEEEYIKQDAEKIIPFPLDALYWDYHITTKEDGNKKAVFVGVPKTDLDAYVEAFSSAHVQPSFVGSELFSLGRALLPKTELHENYFIIDIGADTTTIGMFSSDAIADMSITIPKGGDFFTSVIADELGIPEAEAEEIKRTFGVEIAHKKSRAPHVLRDHLEPVIEKIVEAKKYFEGKTGKEVHHFILSGGSARMRGLCELIAEKTSVECTLADPLSQIQNQTVFGTETPGILFATVIGLALQAHSHLPSINLLPLYRFEAGERKKELIDVREIRTVSDFQYFIFSHTLRIKQFVGTKLPRRLPSAHTVQVIGSFLFLALTLTFLVWVIFRYM